jgi:hypothetical protein
VPATQEYARPVGRTLEDGGITWLAQSGSAVEFAVKGTSLSVQVAGDNGVDKEANQCPRFAVLVDGEVLVDETLNERSRTVEVFSSQTPRDATVEVIQLSEAKLGTIGVEAITVYSDVPSPVAPTDDKDLCIEFVGDSITCGYGVEAASADEPFTTATENFMKSYAYFAAKELDVDYETVCYSGYGVVSGWSADGTLNEEMLVPPLYEVVSKDHNVPWDFSVRPNDVVVVSLGTNDFTYTGTDEGRMSEFARAYAEFLLHVRECNPQALIVCTLGTMGCEELYPYIEQAVGEYREQTGDEHIVCYLSEAIDVETEGMGAAEHPTEKTQRRCARALVEVIRTELGI